jgi:hypothetical protein
MKQVATLAELKQASKANAPEILIVDPGLAKKMQVWQIIRMVSNVLVFVVLGLGIFAWANPLQIAALDAGGFRIARQVLLGFGIALLFLEYLLPGVRTHKIAGREAGGLKLVSRR